jgi:hypothetical protein
MSASYDCNSKSQTRRRQVALAVALDLFREIDPWGPGGWTRYVRVMTALVEEGEGEVGACLEELIAIAR